MKNTIINFKTLSLAIGFFLFLIVPIGQVRGEVETEFIKNDVLQMEMVADDYEEILDYKNTNVCIEYDKNNLKCLSTFPAITYLSVEKEKLINEFENENIEKRTFNTIVFNNNTYRIYSGQPFYKEENQWYETKTVTVTKDNWNAIIEYKTTNPTIDELISINNPFKIYTVNAQTAYSGGGDGYLRNYDAGSWSTARNSSTGQEVGYNSGTINPVQGTFTEGLYFVDWVSLPFDTSAIEDNYTITSATLFVKPYSITASQTFSLTQSTPNSFLSLITDDFDQRGTTLLADEISTSTTAWIDFELNSSGKNIINDTGYTAFAIRDKKDFDNTTPSSQVYTNFYNSEYAGTENDPYLVVTAEAPTEPPTATTTSDLFPCEVPENTLIQRITGCKNIYGTSSTSSPEQVEYFYFDIPIALLIFIYLLIGLGLSIVFIFIFINKKK